MRVYSARMRCDLINTLLVLESLTNVLESDPFDIYGYDDTVYPSFHDFSQMSETLVVHDTGRMEVMGPDFD